MSEHWLIVGANRGIGLELARQLTARGDRVTASVRNDEARAALSARLAPQHAAVETLVFDSRDLGAVRKAAAATDARFDVVIANAGAYGPSPQSALGVDYDAALELFSINTLGPLRIAEAFLPRLKGAANPRIGLMSSELGSTTSVLPSAAVYSATKAALNKFTQCLAEDLKPQGVTVVALHPGWVKTDMGGANAPLSVTESAQGLLATLDGLSIEDSGSFFNYRGETLAW
jgi:NAD(P)-dependent dehydrogenase (short-subunit alcohol dehydrogenase family)